MEGSRFEEVPKKQKSVKTDSYYRKKSPLPVLTIIYLVLAVLALGIILIPFKLSGTSFIVVRIIGGVSLYLATSYFMVIASSREIVDKGFWFNVGMTFVYVLVSTLELTLIYFAFFDSSFLANKNSIMAENGFYPLDFYIILVFYHVCLLICSYVSKAYGYWLSSVFFVVLFAGVLAVGFVIYLIYVMIGKLSEKDEEKTTKVITVLILLIGFPPLGVIVAIGYLTGMGEDTEIYHPSNTYVINDDGTEKVVEKEEYDPLLGADVYKDENGDRWVQDPHDSDSFYKKE